MSKEKLDVPLMGREDVLKALHNTYTEKFVTACLAEKFYQHKKDNPKNGDDMEKIEANIENAGKNIVEYNFMLSLIDEILNDYSKIQKMGGFDERKTEKALKT